MLNERDLNQLLDELNTIAMELEPEFQQVEVRHSIAVARAKLAAKTSCNHSIEKSLESLRNSDKDYFRIIELCKLANTYLTSGELVKAKDVLKETTKSVHQLEYEHEHSRAFFAIQRGLLGIVDFIHSWCALQSITEVIDPMSRQIGVSEDLFWKLEKMRVKDKLDYLEDLLWKLIAEPIHIPPSTPPQKEPIKSAEHRRYLMEIMAKVKIMGGTKTAKHRRNEIKLITEGEEYNDACKNVAENVNIHVNTIYAACTRQLGRISADEFRAIVNDPDCRKELLDKSQ